MVVVKCERTPTPKQGRRPTLQTLIGLVGADQEHQSNGVLGLRCSKIHDATVSSLMLCFV